MRRRDFAVCGGIALGAAFVRFPADAAEFTWKCGTGPGPDRSLNVRLAEAFRRILAESKGRVDIKLFAGAALGNNASMVSQLRLGALEMMADTGDDFDSFVTTASIDNVPFAYSSPEVAYRAFDGGLGNIVRSQFLSHGLVPFDRVYESGFRQFTSSTKPIRVVDDLQGLKLRVSPSKFRLDLFRSLGASPTPVSYAELYTALQTHVVDAADGPLSGIDDQKLYEVQKYCSMSNHMWAAFWVLANKEKWDSMPRNLQVIVRKYVDAGAIAQRNDTTAGDRALRERLSKRGMGFNEVEVAGFKNKLKSAGFYSRWREAWGPVVWAELEKYSGPLA